MTLNEFVTAHINTYVRCSAPSCIGGQCMDLVNLYGEEVLGIGNPFTTELCAKDVWTAVLPQFTKSTSISELQAGDIVIWGTDVGVCGHIDVCVDPGDLLTHFTGFDQNWPIGAPCALVTHTFFGALGAIRYHSPFPPSPEVDKVWQSVIVSDHDLLPGLQNSDTVTRFWNVAALGNTDATVDLYAWDAASGVGYGSVEVVAIANVPNVHGPKQAYGTFGFSSGLSVPEGVSFTFGVFVKNSSGPVRVTVHG